METLELYDITIIGGGPAGMYAAFYSGMRDMKTKVIEAKEELGGKMLLYPEKMIWDVGGVGPIPCRKLIDQLKEQAATFDPTFVFGQHITGCERLADGTYLLISSEGHRHWTRTILVAAGYGILKMAKLEIEGADRYEVTNLHYTVQELEPFRNKRVLISGGGNSAVDWANELAPLTAELTVVHRRDKFGGHEKNVARMHECATRVLTPYAVNALHSANGCDIHKVTLTHMEAGGSMEIEVDAVIVNHGLTSDFGPLRKWGLDFGEWNLNVSERLATNLPGIFAAGDSANYGSKIRLIAGAFTDAALAVNSAKLYLDPEAPAAAYVSSHNDRFKEKNRQLGVAESV